MQFRQPRRSSSCRRSGLVLTPDKNALAHGRLGPVAQRFGFRDTAALLAELPYPSEELARAVTEALTINETSFFRDGAMFDYLARAALPASFAPVMRRDACASGRPPHRPARRPIRWRPSSSRRAFSDWDGKST